MRNEAPFKFANIMRTGTRLTEQTYYITIGKHRVMNLGFMWNGLSDCRFSRSKKIQLKAVILSNTDCVVSQTVVSRQLSPMKQPASVLPWTWFWGLKALII